MEIFIDEKDKLDAAAAANAFAHNDTRDRAYINTLGAELAMKYLESENINVSDIYNLHSIKKLLEEFDISDVLLPNIHIDVRMIFDENAVFIPKSHFEYELTPDIYIVLKPSVDFSTAECLGFFEPKLINKNNQNRDYYFIEKEKLNSPLDLKQYIENFKGSSNKELSTDEIEKCETVIISMADNDISTNDKKYLIQKLLQSADLRAKFIEYENFETLSYKAMVDSSVMKRQLVEDVTEELSDDITDSANLIEDITIPQDMLSLPAMDSEDMADNITGFDNLEQIVTDEQDEEALPEESIGFDALEQIDLPEAEDDLVEDTVSLDDVDLVPVDNQVSEVLQDVASFDDISDNLPELDINLEQDSILPKDAISFDELESETDLEPVEDFKEDEEPVTNIVEDSVSDVLEDISLDTVEDTVQDVIEDISLDTVEDTVQDVIEDISLDAVEDTVEDVVEDISTDTVEDTVEEIEPANVAESVDADFQETLPKIEDIINEEDIKIDDVAEDAQTLQVTEEISDDDIIESLDDSQESSSFGNNLLENLKEESFDNVNIESSNPEVSSDELLSEIDDILNTTSDVSVENVDIAGIADDVADIMGTTDFTDVEDTVEDVVAEGEVSQENSFSMDDLMGSDDSSDTELEVLYTEDAQSSELPPEQVPVKSNNKKTVVVAAALVTVLAAASVFSFVNKNSQQDEISDIAPVENTSTNDNIISNNTPPVVNREVKKEVPAKELKNVVPATPQTVMSVNRIVWDVPDSISYSKGMQNYLKTAGKSIKISLSTDLLLATEFAYTNQVKVGLKMSNSGSILDSKIISGSGSTQIDNIVLQSVKDTLNVLKPPANEVKDPDFNLNLIIYF